ncbi:MAG: gluconate 2-dehydrogenase subunit 3 family protein [Bdellovibrionia bacterium]
MSDSRKPKLPRNPITGEPIPPRAQPGYYPGFSTLSQKEFWDSTTRELVVHRVEDIPPLRFFNYNEAVIFEAVLNRILPQEDRDKDHRIPILHYIDQRLFEKKFNGYIYEGMPDEDEAHRLAIVAIDQMARERHGKAFPEISVREQEEILKSIHDGKPCGALEIWKRMSPQHYWTLLVQDACAAYYSHPYAWDEIGFGGPAYPRGYMRLSGGRPEPWEVDERRYEWLAPEDTISDSYQNQDDLFAGARHGQGGTH